MTVPAPVPRPRWQRHAAIGVLFAAGAWVAEGFVHWLVFRHSGPWVLLWPEDAHDAWMRGLLAAVMLAFTAHVVVDVRKIDALRAEAERLHRELDAALTHALSGFIPVCAGCKSIRDEEGEWEPMESYLAGRTEAEFTHGLCPACRERLYPGLPHAGGTRGSGRRSGL